jgi:HAD superfamily hydrolase (TIGR01509 family)
MEALIFDVDGTLADTEAAHREAFNAAFADVGLDWHWDEALYTRLLEVAGGKERILHYWRCIEPEEASGLKAAEAVEAVHAIKTQYYANRVCGDALPLRPGIRRLIEEANDAGVPIAIATTTTPANLDALLAAPLGVDWRKRFAAVCDASTTPAKKPAPDVYWAVLSRLGLDGSRCIAFEDSENGLRAASAAGVAVVVTPTAYTRHHHFDDALVVLPHLGDPDAPLPSCEEAFGIERGWVDLAVLRRWHADAVVEARW